jgi:hypothetical protein
MSICSSSRVLIKAILQSNFFSPPKDYILGDHSLIIASDLHPFFLGT